MPTSPVILGGAHDQAKLLLTPREDARDWCVGASACSHFHCSCLCVPLSCVARGAGGALRHSHYLPAHSGVRLFRVPHTLRTTLVSRKGVRAFGTGQDSSCMRLRASLGRRHCSMAFDVMVYMFASMAFTTVPSQSRYISTSLRDAPL